MPLPAPFPRVLSEEATTAALARAKERLDRLDLYPAPVETDRVRLVVFPLSFRVPGLRRYRGYALWRTILLRRAPAGADVDDLLTHELCHVWQMQHRPWAAMWAWLRYRYADNPFEQEARRAVAETRSG
jgi:hypothetical protein